MAKFETSCIHFAVTASLLHYSWKRTTSVPDNPLLSTLSPYGCRNSSQVCALCTDRTEGQLYRPRLGKCKDRESRMIMYIDNDVDISVFALSWLHCTWVSRKNYTSCVTTKWSLNRQFIRLKIFFDQRVIWRCGHYSHIHICRQDSFQCNLEFLKSIIFSTWPRKFKLQFSRPTIL